MSKFPETIYSSINKETNYNCQGSSCSCKYLKNRTEFDGIFNSNSPQKISSYLSSYKDTKILSNYNAIPRWKYLGV